MAMSFFFTDDLTAVIAGQIGIRYTDQCIDLERRLCSFFLTTWNITQRLPFNQLTMQKLK